MRKKFAYCNYVVLLFEQVLTAVRLVQVHSRHNPSSPDQPPCF